MSEVSLDATTVKLHWRQWAMQQAVLLVAAHVVSANELNSIADNILNWTIRETMEK